MIAVNEIKMQLIGTLICLVVITLASVVTGQQAQPYQYPSPYQNAFNHDRRSYSPYSGFRASSLSPNNGELVRFPDAHLTPMSAAHGIANQNAFIGRHKKDMSRNDRSSEVSGLMQHYLFFLNYYFPFHSTQSKKYIFIQRNAFKFFKYFCILI